MILGGRRPLSQFLRKRARGSDLYSQRWYSLLGLGTNHLFMDLITIFCKYITNKIAQTTLCPHHQVPGTSLGVQRPHCEQDRNGFCSQRVDGLAGGQMVTERELVSTLERQEGQALGAHDVPQCILTQSQETFCEELMLQPKYLRVSKCQILKRKNIAIKEFRASKELKMCKKSSGKSSLFKLFKLDKFCFNITPCLQVGFKNSRLLGSLHSLMSQAFFVHLWPVCKHF